MKINLLSIELENFKGIKQFKLTTEGKSVNVFGDNRTGKTTLHDAFRWLLFDKNSNDEKVFGIKTSGMTGAEHAVELILSVDDVPLKLKKSYHEKWTRKRGSESPEHTGHESDYWIDEVPSSKGEFDSKVKSLCDEKLFKILTDVHYFNGQIKWEERRKTLIEIVGDVDDLEVINADKKLASLAEIIKVRSVEDHIKIVKEKKKKINSELKDIPVRISEVEKSKPESPELSLVDLNALHKELQNLISQLSSNVGKADLTLERFKENTKLRMEYTTKLQKESEAIDRAYRMAKTNLQDSNDSKQATLRSGVQRCKEAVTQLNEGIALKNKFLAGFVNDFKLLKELKFDESTTVCQTCKREYETIQVEEFKANFNSDLMCKANAIKQKNAATKDEISKLNDDLMIAKLKLEEAEKSLAAFKPELVVTEPNYETESIIDLRAKLERINKEIDTYSSGVREVEDTSEVDAVNVQISEINKDLQKWTTIETLEKRIEQLKSDEKRLSQEYVSFEGQEFVAENFIKAKVEALRLIIDSMFKMVGFKLFKDNINGGVEECCEATYKNVVYQDLNNEGKINAGLDVINCLSKYYEVSCPIFLDNAESVTQYLDTPNQLIRLYVSEQDKSLRMEEI